MSENAQFFTATQKAEAAPEVPAEPAPAQPQGGTPGAEGYLTMAYMSRSGAAWQRKLFGSGLVFAAGFFAVLSFFSYAIVRDNPIGGLACTVCTGLIALLFMLGAIFIRLRVIAEVLVQLYEREIRKP